MKHTHLLLILAALLLGLNQSTYAYWPTTVEEALPIAAEPGITETTPRAISYNDGSTLVIYNRLGSNIQIIDRFGDLKYPIPPKLLPGFGTSGVTDTQIISDGVGGVFIIGESYHPTIQGIIAQRLDSLGNRLWGDMGVTMFPDGVGGFDACPDESGGFIVVVMSGLTQDEPNLWAQRVDADGNLLWGSPGAPIFVNPSTVERWHNCSDGNGGCFAIWESNLLSSDMQLFMQHVDASGTNAGPLVGPILNLPWYHDIISDGEGGCIVEANSGEQVGHWRFDQNCNQLWYNGTWSWFYNNSNLEPVLGEPGFAYLGFAWLGGDYYGQRIDLDGNAYWPTYPAELGARFNVSSFSGSTASLADYSYADDYFYAMWTINYPNNLRQLYMSKLDTNGVRQYNGAEVQIWDYPDGYVISDLSNLPLPDGGQAGVFQTGSGLAYVQDVFAKRVNPDGTLGGPLHLLVDLEPESSSIQIPPTGGSFTYNIAIADTYVVRSHFDAWIEVTLPGGDTREITLREGMNIDSNSVIERFDLVQNVPDWAPAGDYAYTLYVGDHDYPDWFWTMDEFGFEKVDTSSQPQNYSQTLAGASPRAAIVPVSGSGATPTTGGGWHLTGFFGDSADPKLTVSPQDIKVSVHPNPFNAQTEISFILTKGGRLVLSIYDLSGREVKRLTDAYFPAGNQQVIWNAEKFASGIYFVKVQQAVSESVKKLILLK